MSSEWVPSAAGLPHDGQTVEFEVEQGNTAFGGNGSKASNQAWMYTQ